MKFYIKANADVFDDAEWGVEAGSGVSFIFLLEHFRIFRIEV